MCRGARVRGSGSSCGAPGEGRVGACALPLDGDRRRARGVCSTDHDGVADARDVAAHHERAPSTTWVRRCGAARPSRSGAAGVAVRADAASTRGRADGAVGPCARGRALRGGPSRACRCASAAGRRRPHHRRHARCRCTCAAPRRGGCRGRRHLYGHACAGPVASGTDRSSDRSLIGSTAVVWRDVRPEVPGRTTVDVDRGRGYSLGHGCSPGLWLQVDASRRRNDPRKAAGGC